MNGPTLSVVIPTFRRAHVLHRAIRSVISQNGSFVEVIIADDGSPDDTAQLVTSFASHDPRVRIVRRASNGGTSAARNLGARAARGEWITFLDDDDEMLPGFIGAMRSALTGAAPSVGFAWSGVRWVRDIQDNQENVLRDEIWHPTFDSRTAAYRGFLRHRRIGSNCGLTFRRSAFLALGGFDESLRAAVDTDLLIRAAQDYDFIVVPEIYIKVHLHQGTHVRHDTRARAETYRRLVQKHDLALKADPGLAAAVLYKSGWLFYHAGDKRRGRRQIFRALRHRPLSVRSWTVLAAFELLGRRAIGLHKKLASFRIGRLSVANAA